MIIMSLYKIPEELLDESIHDVVNYNGRWLHDYRPNYGYDKDDPKASFRKKNTINSLLNRPRTTPDQEKRTAGETYKTKFKNGIAYEQPTTKELKGLQSPTGSEKLWRFADGRHLTHKDMML